MKSRKRKSKRAKRGSRRFLTKLGPEDTWYIFFGVKDTWVVVRGLTREDSYRLEPGERVVAV